MRVPQVDVLKIERRRWRGERERDSADLGSVKDTAAAAVACVHAGFLTLSSVILRRGLLTREDVLCVCVCVRACVCVSVCKRWMFREFPLQTGI